MRIDLNQYNVFEKYDWLEGFYGEYRAMLYLLEKLGKDSHKILIKYHAEIGELGLFESENWDVEVCVGWFFDNYSSVDAIELLRCTFNVDEVVDRLLVGEELDLYESEFGYESIEDRQKL